MAIQAEAENTRAVVNRFNEAFGRHDLDAIMAMMTEDCIFESTSPPNGHRYQGQAAVRAFWEEFFQSSAHAAFDAEEVILAGDRCTVRWIYRWTDSDTMPGHIRGVDIFRVRGDRVAEKCSYVKG